jgi:DNA/RNA-binding domain of Phe-tRNA-synthetase-like protein
MEYFTVSSKWKSAFPGAHAGILVMQEVANPPASPGLDRLKDELVADLRLRYGAADRAVLGGLPVLQAYSAYYKRFKKTYHVQHQLESVAWKSRDLPRAAALVEAMFMAELKDLLLTAGHDLDALQLPVRLDIARGGETYTLLRGDPAELKEGDMYMQDGEGIISSILYGPDARTQITPDTRRVFFAVYAPAGIEAEAVRRHLEEIAAYVSIVAPEAQVLLSEVY